jgi:hypothetical protein
MALTVGSVAAQEPAYRTAFTTSITYQNISTDAATIAITFYGSGTPYTYNREEPLPAGAGTSLFVGGLNNVESGFQGAAVLSSNAPIVATMVQVPQNNTEVKNRPLSNGFTGDQGASRYLIPTALRTRFQATTIFSAQNVDSVALDITANFYEVAENTPTATITRQNVQPGASTYFDLGDSVNTPGIPENFNGSAIVTATHTGNAATAGRIVASAMELGTQGNSVAAQYRAAAFEGSRQGAQKVYMPTALCAVFGGQTTAYAVQNTTNAQITVTVTYYNATNGEVAGTQEKPIAGNAKESFIACDAGVGNNFSGSAVVESSVADSIVAIGKKFVPQGILTTAFAGSPVGSSSLALPYVRWATATNYQAGNDRGQRAFIAVQNVGPDAVSGVQVLYKNPDGETVCTHDLAELPSGQKLNSNVGTNCPALTETGFGYWPNGTFGGSVIVQGPAGSQLLAVATIQSFFNNTVVAEDYNGIPTAD